MAQNESSVYLLVGSSGGIGSALAQQLATTGARLMLAGRDTDRLAAQRHQLAQIHPTGSDDIRTSEVDAIRSADVDRAVAETVDAFGKLDGAVNLVGSVLLKPIHLTSEDDWRTQISLNLDSAFYLVRAAVKPMMTAKTGAIVLMSTVATKIGLGNHEAIAAAKAGVNGLVLSAAATYAPRGIRVNAVAPGLTRTPLTERITANESSLNASKAMHPMGRIGEPSDVADAIAWLLDPARSWVTGQVLSVDGGLSSVRSK